MCGAQCCIWPKFTQYPCRAARTCTQPPSAGGPRPTRRPLCFAALNLPAKCASRLTTAQLPTVLCYQDITCTACQQLSWLQGNPCSCLMGASTPSTTMQSSGVKCSRSLSEGTCRYQNELLSAELAQNLCLRCLPSIHAETARAKPLGGDGRMLCSIIMVLMTIRPTLQPLKNGHKSFKLPCAVPRFLHCSCCCCPVAHGAQRVQPEAGEHAVHRVLPAASRCMRPPCACCHHSL